MTHQVVRTRQGHLAVRCDQAGEVMHPGVGPLVEARELYVSQSRLGERLREPAATPLVLFDVGLGAGSNALAARAESEGAPASARPLHLISFERDLGALALALEPDHRDAFGLQGTSAEAARALLAEGEHRSPRTWWQLRRGDLLQALGAEAARADVVFWDPFSPRANPGLWTVAAFAALRARAGARCALYTYSSSTATRVAMLLAGWAVGVGQAIGDRAETTAAAVEVGDLRQPLGHRFLERLARSQAVLPADAPADARDRIAAAPQFLSATE